MATDLHVRRDTIMAHYMSNHIAVAYGDIFDEMVALSQAVGFKVRILGAKERSQRPGPAPDVSVWHRLPAGGSGPRPRAATT